jgi:hypothetical protein
VWQNCCLLSARDVSSAQRRPPPSYSQQRAMLGKMKIEVVSHEEDHSGEQPRSRCHHLLHPQP